MSSIKIVRLGDELPITPDPLHAILREAALNGAPKTKGATWTPQHQKEWKALREGNFTIYQRLKDQGAKFDWVDADGRHAMHVAALGGNVAIIEDLTKSGHDINVINSKTKETPVLCALSVLKTDAILYLKKLGAVLPEDFERQLHEADACLYPKF